MESFSHQGISADEPAFDVLPWIPGDLRESLSAIVAFLRETFRANMSRIGLYGSWQRGDATLDSDVDLVVFLDNNVAWFDAEKGVVNRCRALKDRSHWNAIEKKANAHRLDARVYSIAVVTPGMLEYYSTRGPIHMQNWAHALTSCYVLWKG